MGNPIICKICGNKSRYIKEAYTHNREVHEIIGKNRTTTCILCNFSYNSENILKIHTAICHPEYWGKNYLTHSPVINVWQAIKEANDRLLFEASIKEIFQKPQNC